MQSSLNHDSMALECDLERLNAYSNAIFQITLQRLQSSVSRPELQSDFSPSITSIVCALIARHPATNLSIRRLRGLHISSLPADGTSSAYAIFHDVADRLAFHLHDHIRTCDELNDKLSSLIISTNEQDNDTNSEKTDEEANQSFRTLLRGIVERHLFRAVLQELYEGARELGVDHTSNHKLDMDVVLAEIRTIVTGTKIPTKNQSETLASIMKAKLAIFDDSESKSETFEDDETEVEQQQIDVFSTLKATCCKQIQDEMIQLQNTASTRDKVSSVQRIFQLLHEIVRLEMTLCIDTTNYGQNNNISQTLTHKMASIEPHQSYSPHDYKTTTNSGFFLDMSPVTDFQASHTHVPPSDSISQSNHSYSTRQYAATTQWSGINTFIDTPLGVSATILSDQVVPSSSTAQLDKQRFPRESTLSNLRQKLFESQDTSTIDTNTSNAEQSFPYNSTSQQKTMHTEVENQQVSDTQSSSSDDDSTFFPSASQAGNKRNHQGSRAFSDNSSEFHSTRKAGGVGIDLVSMDFSRLDTHPRSTNNAQIPETSVYAKKLLALFAYMWSKVCLVTSANKSSSSPCLSALQAQLLYLRRFGDWRRSTSISEDIHSEWPTATDLQTVMHSLLTTNGHQSALYCATSLLDAATCNWPTEADNHTDVNEKKWNSLSEAAIVRNSSYHTERLTSDMSKIVLQALKKASKLQGHHFSSEEQLAKWIESSCSLRYSTPSTLGVKDMQRLVGSFVDLVAIARTICFAAGRVVPDT